MSMQCGELGPGEADAGYAISGKGETEPEAIARRQRVARLHELGGTVTMTRLDVITPGGAKRLNAGPLDERIAAARMRARSESSGREEGKMSQLSDNRAAGRLGDMKHPISPEELMSTTVTLEEEFRFIEELLLNRKLTEIEKHSARWNSGRLALRRHAFAVHRARHGSANED